MVQIFNLISQINRNGTTKLEIAYFLLRFDAEIQKSWMIQEK